MAIESPLYQDMIPSVLMPDVRPVRYSEGGFTLYDNRINKVKTYTPQISEAIIENGQLGVSIFGGVKVEVFLSDDGGALIDELEKNKSRILQSTNLIQIFIETDKDTFSKNVLKVIAGKITRNKEELDLANVLKPIYALTQQQVENILGVIFKQSKNFLATFWDTVTTTLVVLPEKLLSTALGISIDLIENLRLSDSWWQMNEQRRKQSAKESEDADSKGIEDFIEELITHAKNAIDKISGINKEVANKYLKKWKGALSKTLQNIGDSIDKVTKAMQQFMDWIQTIVRESGWFTRGIVAFLCGVWNGLVDMVTGLLFIVKVVLDGGKAVRQGAVTAINSRERLLEEVDNFYDSLGNVAWKEVYAEITEQVKALPSLLDLVSASLEKMKQAKDKAVKEVSEISKSEWAYYIGYGITFVIPTAAVANLLGKAGKVGKSFGKFLVWIEKAMNDAFGFVLQKGKTALDNLIELFKKITEKFREGAKGLNQLIKKFFAALREWIESITGKKTDDAFSKLFTNKELIQSLKDLGLTIAERDSYFEIFYEGKRLLVGAEDEIIKTSELLAEKDAGKVKKMLKQATENTENSFIITDELLASLKKRKKIVDDVINKIEVLSSDKIKGNFGEIRAAYHFETAVHLIDGKLGLMKRVSVDVVESLDQPIRKGIDAVYEFSSPPPKYIINEVKYGTADLKWNKTKTLKQMDFNWIDKNILNAVKDRNKAYEIMEGFENSNTLSVLSKANPSGALANVKLNNQASKIGNL